MSVHCHIDHGVCEIRFARPEKLNAITPAMWVELNAALDRAEADPRVRVILFSSEGRAFCAGADLNAFSAESLADGVPSGLDNPGGRFTARLPEIDRVMVAAVQGHVVGFGTSLILQCDYVLAADDARFALPFIARGFVPEGGSSLALVQRVGPLRAAQMMLAGEPVDATTALAWGLVTRIVDAEALGGEAHALARRIAAQPPAALRRTRQLLRQPSADIQAQMQREAEAFSAQLASAEVAEAMAAFQQRRPADFSGCE